MANPFGYEYDPSKLQQGWSPWAFWHTPQDNPNYNYTNATSLYNPNQDTIDHTWGGSAGNPVHSRSRDIVTRWTEDDLRSGNNDFGWRGDPGSAPSNVLNAVFMRNIARLHRDFDRNGWNWAQSGFSGFDQLLSTPRPEGSQALNSGIGGVPNQGASRPGGPPPGNPNGGPPVPGAPAASGAAPGRAGATGAGGAGNAAFESVLGDTSQQGQEAAYNYMLQQIGWDPTTPSRFGDFLKQRFSPLLQASLAASRAGDPSGYLSGIESAITNFGQGMVQQGGNFFGDLRNQADSALGNPDVLSFLQGIDNQQAVEGYLNQLATLRYADANPMVQQAIADSIQRAQTRYDTDALAQVRSGASAGDPYLEWLRRNPQYNRYVGVRF